jgi:hypothetical protein
LQPPPSNFHASYLFHAWCFAAGIGIAVDLFGTPANVGNETKMIALASRPIMIILSTMKMMKSPNYRADAAPLRNSIMEKIETGGSFSTFEPSDNA